MRECEICGDTSHADDSEAAHGRALCVYQPSLHREAEWVNIVTSEAEAFTRSHNASDALKARAVKLVEEWNAEDEDGDYFSEACYDYIRDAEDIIGECGLLVYSENDSWLVFEPAKEQTEP